jgi:hypothetical protein
MTAMHNDDLDTILQQAFPQGTTMLQHECGIELLNHGARALISTPYLAFEVLGAQASAAMGNAAVALGEQYVQIGRALLELAAKDPSMASKACSGAPHSMEPET